MTGLLTLPRLGPRADSPFPPVDEALDSPQGLLAWGGGLEPQRLLNAYAAGIFPWYSEGQPILWWSPAPRCVLFPDEVYLSRRTRRRYNSGSYSLTADRAFDQVIDLCAAPRDDQGTWITPEMREAYVILHGIGFAHSIEVWCEDELVGGIYGLSLDKVFFGESMFSRHTDASKLALIGLCRELSKRDMALLDCQVSNPHLVRMGARDISRARFCDHLPGEDNLESFAGSWAESYEPDSAW